MSGPFVLPPELRLLTTSLSTTPPPQLLQLLPTLSSHVLQCRGILLRPIDQKPTPSGSSTGNASAGSASAAEGANHVQRLRASISSLLNGRTSEGRLVGAVLAKAVVDVGGLEAIKGTDSWIRGLLLGLQARFARLRNDAPIVKELCLVTLTKIYLGLHAYPTLVREIATPTLPTFITALVPLLSVKQPTAKNQKSLPPPLPMSLVTLAIEAVATLIPLYPTTMRPFESSINAALRPYLAPTSDDATAVPIPETVRQSGRRAFMLLHHVAAKAAGKDVWIQQVHGLFLRESYCAADQCFRAVEEAWRSGYRSCKSKIDLDEIPKGGGSGPDELPPWEGIRAGTERLVGALECLAAALSHPTKTDVPILLGELVDVCTRMSLISRHSPRKHTWEQSLPTTAAAQRTEKDELWAAMPAIHVATMNLLLVLVKRLQASATPVASQMLECLVRIFRSGTDVREVRMTAYKLLAALVRLCGPTLTRSAVASIDPLIATCCRDLQQAAGFLQSPAPAPAPAPPPSSQQPSGPQSTDAKKPAAVIAHADAFLASSSSWTATSAAPVPPLSKKHTAAADSLLVALLTHLPHGQGAIKPPVRALLDRTAVLAQSRDALLASVLSPYRDSAGSLYANLMPFLAGMHPADQSIEVLRTNLRMDGGGVQEWTEVGPLDTAESEDAMDEDDDVLPEEQIAAPEPAAATATAAFRPARAPTSPEITSAFLSPAKRQHDDDAHLRPLKRHEPSADFGNVSSATAVIHITAESSQPVAAIASPPPSLIQDTKGLADGSDSDDESVHLNMTFDDDDEEDE